MNTPGSFTDAHAQMWQAIMSYICNKVETLDNKGEGLFFFSDAQRNRFKEDNSTLTDVGRYNSLTPGSLSDYESYLRGDINWDMVPRVINVYKTGNGEFKVLVIIPQSDKGNLKTMTLDELLDGRLDLLSSLGDCVREQIISRNAP